MCPRRCCDSTARSPPKSPPRWRRVREHDSAPTSPWRLPASPVRAVALAEKPVGPRLPARRRPGRRPRRPLRVARRAGLDPLPGPLRRRFTSTPALDTEPARRGVSSGATVTGDERLRLFLALRLPDVVRDRLAAWAGDHASGAGRLVPREDLHVTLAFLGSRPAGELDAIVAALREAALAAGSIELAPAGWRETRSCRHGPARTSRRGRRAPGRRPAPSAWSGLGVYRREARPWLAHVTVVRFRERPRLRPPLPELGAFVPSDAAAYLSRLHPSGARYEVLASTLLGGRG